MDVSLVDVERAMKRVQGHVVRTPIIRSDLLEQSLGFEFLGFKCENLQRTGAFKARGATNAVSAVVAASPEVQVFVTHSSGNHGQALAFACKKFGKRAIVVVPKNAPKVKVEGLRRLNAVIQFCEPTQAAREAACQALLAANPGSRLVHPYDDPLVISGQGTLGLEIFEECPDLDAVIVPVGGGGLISGVATAIKGRNPNIRVIGAEPLNADDAARSVAAGGDAPLAHRPGMPDTIGDGLRGSLSRRTFTIIRNRVDSIVTVSEDDMKAAMRLAFDELRVVIEPSAAVGVALALLPQYREKLGNAKRVVVVLCGGNLDIDLLHTFLSPKL